MRNKRFLLFDLDGTLTDPGIGITNSVQYALAKFNIFPKTREELFPYIGPPLTDSFQNYHGLSPEESLQALAFYREYFTHTGIFENTLFPGMTELLQNLRDAGYSLIIATSKPEEYTVRILDHFGLTPFFDFVAGNTLAEERPTKADVIRYICSHFPEINEKNTLMIGDRHHDVEGAKENGIPTVGVSYGYGSSAELESAGAIAIADDLYSLFDIIKSNLSL